MKTEFLSWTQHPKADEVAAMEYAILQGFCEDTKENWKVVDDLRDDIDKELNSKS